MKTRIRESVTTDMNGGMKVLWMPEVREWFRWKKLSENWFHSYLEARSVEKNYRASKSKVTTIKTIREGDSDLLKMARLADALKPYNTPCNRQRRSDIDELVKLLRSMDKDTKEGVNK